MLRIDFGGRLGRELMGHLKLIHLVFDVDGEGKALAVGPAATRARLMERGRLSWVVGVRLADGAPEI